MKKPAFINPVQRVRAGVIRTAKLDPAATATSDGAFPVDMFHPGLAEMSEEDYRQFRVSPEDAIKMVDKANADLAAGKKLRGNYGHDRSGPIAGQVVRAEVSAGGGVRTLVKWTERASAAIHGGEYEGVSPEFYARVVLNEKGEPLEENGRVILEPFEICGFALDNDPAMPSLALSATTEPEKPEGAKEDEMETKKLAAMLGLPETASVADMEKAMEAMKKTMADMDAAMKSMKGAAGAESAPTLEAVAALVLAKINPDELAKTIRAAAVKEATDAFRAETLEKAVVETVDAAIRGGRVKKSERDQALKLAKADLESFKTMTASMKVVAPVAPIYQAGQRAEGVFDESDPGNDEALVEAAEKRAKEKSISVLAAAREIHAEARAKA